MNYDDYYIEHCDMEKTIEQILSNLKLNSNVNITIYDGFNSGATIIKLFGIEVGLIAFGKDLFRLLFFYAYKKINGQQPDIVSTIDEIKENLNTNFEINGDITDYAMKLLSVIVAHEYGHIEKRHAGIIQNMKIEFNRLISKTDVESIFQKEQDEGILKNPDLIEIRDIIRIKYSIPKCSQEQEREADDFAVNLLKAYGLDGDEFSVIKSILQYFEDEDFKESEVFELDENHLRGLFQMVRMHPPAKERFVNFAIQENLKKVGLVIKEITPITLKFEWNGMLKQSICVNALRDALLKKENVLRYLIINANGIFYDGANGKKQILILKEQELITITPFE